MINTFLKNPSELKLKNDIKASQNVIPERNTTQQAIVFNCAKEGKYFCFCSSDPHDAVLDGTGKLCKGHIYQLSSLRKNK